MARSASASSRDEELPSSAFASFPATVAHLGNQQQSTRYSQLRQQTNRAMAEEQLDRKAEERMVWKPLRRILWRDIC